MINFLFNFSLIITYLTHRGGICFSTGSFFSPTYPGALSALSERPLKFRDFKERALNL